VEEVLIVIVTMEEELAPQIVVGVITSAVFVVVIREFAYNGNVN
jgi:hypothetical protein